MENKSEVLKIIEAGLEHDREKLIAYAHLLMNKCKDDKAFQDAIVDRISGEYKGKPILHLLKNKEDCTQK